MLISGLGYETIAKAVSRTSCERGERYWRAGRVLFVDWEQSGEEEVRIVASVQGTTFQPYQLEAVIEQLSNGALDIEGYCSCPVTYNCKHLAAALFAVKAERPKRQRALPLGQAAPTALSASLSSWVDQLARLDESSSEDYPPDIRQRLIYVLDRRPVSSGAPRLLVAPKSVRLLKDGSFSTNVNSYSPAKVLQSNPAKFLRPSDRSILLRLERLAGTLFPGYGYSDRALGGEEGGEILEAIAETGRARWRAVDGPVVTIGKPRQGWFAWRLEDDAAYHAVFEVDGTGEGERPFSVVAMAPPWYVDEATGVLGPLETGLGPQVSEAIMLAPPVPVGESQLLQQALGTRLPELPIPAPPEPPPREVLQGPPVRRLTLTTCERPRPVYQGWQSQPGDPIPCAKLSFLYGGAEFNCGDRRLKPVAVHNDTIVEVRRSLRFEQAAESQLRVLGFVPLGEQAAYGYTAERNAFVLSERPGAASWHDILYHDIPLLQDSGWDVVVAPGFPVQLVEPDGDIEARLSGGSGIDWFELDVSVMVDGERVELLPALLDIVTGRDFDPQRLQEAPDGSEIVYVSIPDGRTLAIPASRVWRIVSALYELFDTGMAGSADEPLRFSRFDAEQLARMEELTGRDGVVWTGGERLRQLGERLRVSEGIPRTAVPPSFAATLRPYQARGVDWLQFLQTEGFGGILADDMGLGKTVQTLAHLAVEKASGRLQRPALIVAPTSVVPNWRQEAARFAPTLKVLVLHGPRRKERFGEIGEHDVVITTYPLLTRDHATLAAQEWHVVVLDEAQAIKNPDANTSRRARDLRAQQRMCLTGTPVENHLGELWSLFAFLSPGFLGDRKQFNRHWRRPIEANGDEARRELLARRIRPFVLRRTKEEVAAELPPKSQIVEQVEMQPAQRDVYESVRLAMHERVRKALAEQGLARSHIVILDALLKLRQACCDPRLLKLPSAKATRARSAKLERLMEMLPELLEEGRRVLLFSQFTSMLVLIEEALCEQHIAYTRLTGDTRDRETPIRAFQSGEVPLFLVSLKAGGVGLNLTAADTVIHYDPWWNPAVEEQATDRAHRIGQDKPVFVYRLVTLDSIEEKMEALKERKRHLAAGIFDPDAGSALDLTEADVEELFTSA